MIIHALLTAQLAASRCIFIIATPGSGSSLMRATVENQTGCVMSGENWGALLQLSEMHRLIMKTETQPRRDQHSNDAYGRNIFAWPTSLPQSITLWQRCSIQMIDRAGATRTFRSVAILHGMLYFRE